MKECNSIVQLLILFLLTTCANTKSINSGTVQERGISLYYTLGGLSSDLRTFFAQEGYQRILLINQRRIVDAENEWAVDTKRLGAFLRSQLPEKNDDSIIMLNWEGEVFKSILRRDERSITADSLFSEAYYVVKKIRPKTKVGYYGLPIRRYYKRDSTWRSRNEKLYPLLRKLDVLFPSVYDFYVSTNYRGKADLEYVSDNIFEALRAGHTLKKPVLPVIWHRYHTSNKIVGEKLIPISEFTDHIAAIASAARNGKQVDGVVWWGSEWSQFATRNRDKFNDKKELRKAWEADAAEVIPKYYRGLIAGIRKGKKAQTKNR